jgi:hypothetical protein
MVDSAFTGFEPANSSQLTVYIYGTLVTMPLEPSKSTIY